jgi:NAD(P)-dependent dehydrogenase (short-subunit alcohol dehydrogenase family)
MPGTVIVTGASRGIGAATARLAAARGYSVCVNYARSADRAAQVVDGIVEAGGRALAVQADIGGEADILALFDHAERRLGPITALVNNAGVTGPLGRVTEVDSEALCRLMRVNVIGSVLCAREAVRRMSTRRGGQGGVIVNLASAAARLGGAGELVAYATSKGAIDSLTLGLAREVAGEGIRVNAVRPGLIYTDLQKGRDIEAMLPAVPMGRVGTAEEIADAVLWLMSDAARYVTGSILDVTGGR